MRETILIIVCILFVVCYLKNGQCIDEKKPIGILYLGAMLFMFGLLFVISLVLIDQNDDLEKRAKGKCPEYEEVNGLYKVKSK